VQIAHDDAPDFLDRRLLDNDDEIVRAHREVRRDDAACLEQAVAHLLPLADLGIHKDVAPRRRSPPAVLPSFAGIILPQQQTANACTNARSTPDLPLLTVPVVASRG